MESYTNEEGMVVELNPYTFFTVVAGWQKAANNDKIYWCIDFEDPSVGYDNLRKAFESTSDVRLQCYEMDGASLAITNQKADPKYSDIKIQGGQLVQKVVENILSNKTVTNPDLITCKPCPNGGETKDWSGWEGIWNNAAQQCEPASNKHHYYTIANCKGYQRDEKGTYEWVNQSGNNVTSLKCYYTE